MLLGGGAASILEVMSCWLEPSVFVRCPNGDPGLEQWDVRLVSSVADFRGVGLVTETKLAKLTLLLV